MFFRIFGEKRFVLLELLKFFFFFTLLAWISAGHPLRLQLVSDKPVPNKKTSSIGVIHFLIVLKSLDA